MTGTYKQQVSVTKNLPACVLVLIDQSGSMADSCGLDGRPKSVVLARAVNSALDYLVAECTRGELIKDYLHVGIVGYGSGSGGISEPLGQGSAPAGLLKVSELESRASTESVERDDGTGEIITVTRNKWFDPVADGGTPMAEALQLAVQKLGLWTREFPTALPPVVLNVTDAEANDVAKAESIANEVRSIATTDGDTLLFSCHISKSPASPIMFPTNEDSLPDQFSKLLFRMSSDLPKRFIELGRTRKLPMEEGSRGFMFNADAVALVKFLMIGTVVTQAFDR
jgi:hypothetical protein